MKAGRIVIGLVGQQGSGKDTVGDYLKTKYDFAHIATGDLIRQYMIEHNLGPTTRKRIQMTVAKLRRDIGPDYLIDIGLQTNTNQRLILSGLRHPAEGTKIHELGGVLIAVIVSQRTRFDRARKRGRVGDRISFEAFQKLEAAENENADPAIFNIDALIKSADYRLHNDGSQEQLRRSIDKIVSTIL